MTRLFVAFKILTIVSLVFLLGCKASLGKNFNTASSFNKKPSQFEKPSSPDSTTLPEKSPKPDLSPPPETSSNKARFNFPFQQKSNLSYDSIFSITPQSSMDLNIDQKEVNKGWLGISMIEKGKSNAKKQSEEKQIVIQYVIEGSPAQQFGLQKDDIILKLNGEAILPASNISLSQNFSKQIQKLSPGSSVTLTVSRNKVEHDISLISGRYSQGAGIHVSIGTLIDEKGDDRYISTFGVGQGFGHDFGIGVLVDNNGNDFYKGGVLVQGLGNETGIGILYDNNGNDKYVSKGNGPGTGNFSSLHETGSIGLFIDSEGIDSYSSEEKNHQILNRKNWGLFTDI